MDPFVTALVNLGGGFVLSAVILMLHRDALKAFREELKEERISNERNMDKIVAKLNGKPTGP